MYLAQYSITSGYRPANRLDHVGVDFGTPYGTPIPALVAGIVSFAGWITFTRDGKTYRELIIVVQSSGYFVVYGHLSGTLVTVGQQVHPGHIIGHSGNSGYVLPPPTPANPYSGSHLHIERRSGTKAASQPLSAYPSQDITPLLHAYGQPQGGGNDMKIEDFAADILDVIEDNPWYAESKPEAFKGHVNHLKANNSLEGRRSWVKGIMANNRVLNATNMRQHLAEDEQYRHVSEETMRNLDQNVLKAKSELETAQEQHRLAELAWRQAEDGYIADKATTRETFDLALAERETEIANLNQQLDIALQHTKDVARWSWQDHLRAAISKLFGGGETT